MITLYHAPSTAAFVVHWLLIELDIPHELHALDLAKREHKQPAYLAINPAGVVPAAVIDGRVITEAAAIVMHLADVHGLAPAPGTLDRAAYYQWMCFCTNTLQPAFRAWWYPTEPAGEANVDIVKQVARERLEAAWDRLDAQLAAGGPYLLGAERSAVDFMVTMLMRWSRNMPRPAHTWPALARLAQTMKALPSFKEVYRREGITDWT
jgi:glutathione S-transferase